MIQETEDDHLDQSLRDTFSDFDLPPSHHVWTGIESKLSVLPVPSRSVPLVFVLPFVGLVGVAVGWLLPRPAVAPAPRPASELPVKTRMASQHVTSSALSAYVIPRASTEALASGKLATPTSGNHPLSRLATESAKSRIRNVTHASTTQLVPAGRALEAAPLTEARVASLAPLTANDDVPTVVASRVEATTTSVSTGLPSFIEQSEQLITAQNPATKGVEAPELGTRAESLREKRPEYRVPTHRLAERGRGLRRIQNTVVKHWQRIFGPRHAGTAPKDF